MTRQKIKELIHEYESARTGYDRLMDATVSVRNVRITKKSISADIVLIDHSTRTSSRNDRVLFTQGQLEKFHKTRVLYDA